MSTPSPDVNIQQLKQLQGILVSAQKLSVKAFNAQNLQNLIFIILNDTYQIVPYDRALLFRLGPQKGELLGVSGQVNFNLQSELATRLRGAVAHLKDRSNQRVLKEDDFPPDEWKGIQADKTSTIYWIPFSAGKEELGLWLEKYDDPQAAKNFELYAPLIKELLAPAYSAAWERMSRQYPLHQFKRYLNAKNWGILSLLLLLILFFFPVRLRIVAPCEVVAVNSFVVTAPIEGIIEQVLVKPGEEVQKGEILFEYDKKIPMHRFQAAQKQVEILQAELNQAYVLSTANEPTATSQLALLENKLNKSKVDLKFAKLDVSLLIQKSPIDGLVAIDNPDDWRGKPVKVGEKIMTISNKGATKLRIWIPERDNIAFEKDIPLRVFLNSMPGTTFEARFLYISPEVKVIEGELPSFEAEAEWINTKEIPKLGLKGSCVIYGEKVSLIYYLFRKPIGTLRKFIGI